MDKIYESLQLFEEYEGSYKIYKGAQTDPNLTEREESGKSCKVSLTQQLGELEALQKQEAEAALN